METQTVGQIWPLLSGSTNAPTLTAGQQTAFQFQDVPDRSPTGPLAYYLPGVILTFRGTIVTAGTAGSDIWFDQFIQCLFSSLAWIQAWHGSPIQAQHVTGAQWPVTEYYVNGFRYQNGQKGKIASAAAGTYHFETSIFVPFSSCRMGDLEHDTSQLALLARASQLQINSPLNAATLASLSTGSTFGTTTVRASAILVPRQDLILGTPIETILTQIVAGSGNAVKITNFGTDTGLQGVDPGGGVLALNFLTASQNGVNLGGSFASANITDFTWQWRGQAYTQDVLGLLSNWKRLLSNPYAAFLATQAGLTTPDLIGPPYIITNAVGDSPSSTADVELHNLMYWSLVGPGARPRLSNLQTADSDQTFNMTVTGGYTGTHQILGQYARSWQQGMLQNWLAQVMAGGAGSLAAYVLGPKFGSAKLARRGPQGAHIISHDQTRYLPWQLFPSG
jgi:hypothetical protein